MSGRWSGTAATIGGVMLAGFLCSMPQAMTSLAGAEPAATAAPKSTAAKPKRTKPAAKPAAKPAGEAAAAVPADAAKAAGAKVDESSFLRVLRDDKGTPLAMQTAVVRYVGEGKYAGVTVDLIGAVHIGEKSYYQKLNERFTEYEAMLYELVAPKGTKIPKGGGGGRSGHPIGLLQHGMSDALGLVHQMTEVDYTKKNFIHADMTPEEFADSMNKRGESWMAMAFKAMGQGIAKQAQGGNSHPEIEMLAALFDKNPEVSMKRALAKQFEDMEGAIDAFGGKDGSAIITDRNAKALEVLRKQLAKGKKKVAIFYGAAHLPDMHARLLGDFGLKQSTTEWMTAWDMSGAAKRAVEAAKEIQKDRAAEAKPEDDKPQAVKPADKKPARKKATAK